MILCFNMRCTRPLLVGALPERQEALLPAFTFDLIPFFPSWSAVVLRHCVVQSSQFPVWECQGKRGEIVATAVRADFTQGYNRNSGKENSV